MASTSNDNKNTEFLVTLNNIKSAIIEKLNNRLKLILDIKKSYAL